ncbi:FtsL-like putative cell division protein [Hymenobacter sp. H14-R3]|uniref:FtsL-like putative cell division protein n=1 Tax=Hymenobacter sp. H14-R3 TaxID=3046308 RepID=UPI0024BB257C|nr:FtsL-like putative cell division protein [Hymenobacter sp. H14-R3]MDJ0364906.1 FtsL-like putative cell division protein [Hymenobacter sp. H14-R3]
MAGNTIRPNTAGPPRANTLRPPRAPEPAPEEVPAAAVPPPAAAPAAQAQPAAPKKAAKPAPAPTPAAEFTAPAWERHEGVSATGWSLFSLLDRFTGLDGLFREGLPVRFLPKMLFVMLLTLLYIGNTHYGNRMNRNIQRLKLETEDLRADYTTLSSDYMEASKQSEVARKVAAIGLVESSSPPFRIAIPAGRLDQAELETMPVLTADTLAARAARDSVASVRADSIQGRARRQELGLSNDDTPELGAPPPGVAPEEAGATDNDNDLENNEISDRNKRPLTRVNGEKSIKKSKTAQSVPRSAVFKKPASYSKAQNRKQQADSKNHERQR